MNKTDLIDKLLKRTSLKRSDVEEIVNAFMDIIMSEVIKGHPVKLIGFGTFDHSLRRARKRRNPKTGEEIHVPSLRAPRFRPSEEFKRKLNK